MVTAIAGHNATGKSTLLGIIGNACELKATQGKTVTAGQFKTEFSELFKGSQKHDATGQIGTLSISDNGKDTEISLRVAWQKYKKQSKDLDRFRIIPKWTRKNRSVTEGKYPLPSLYLGLSRLYPLGETPTDEVKKKRKLGAMSDADRDWLYKTYNDILTLCEPIESISNFSINKKVSGGINTSKYDYLTNSSGQDNLMQILYALLSFKLLSKKMKSQWKGGVLLIDEIDATLHPVAQIRLLDIILSICENIGLQAIFTTHSLQLLEHLNAKMSRKGKKDNIINYLTTANRDLEVHVNPDQQFINNDMMIENSLKKINRKKVVVYSEDAETRWFIEKILEDYKRYVKIVNMNFGCEQAKKWMKTDPEYFKNILFILDGEVDISPENSISGEQLRNFIVLPGGAPPEQVLHDYLLKLKSGHAYLSENSKFGVTLRFFETNSINSDNYKNIERKRERSKKWFNDNKSLFEETNLFRYWKNDNISLVKKFLGNFKHCHDSIAFRVGAEKMPSLNKSSKP